MLPIPEIPSKPKPKVIKFYKHFDKEKPVIISVESIISCEVYLGYDHSFTNVWHIRIQCNGGSEPLIATFGSNKLAAFTLLQKIESYLDIDEVTDHPGSKFNLSRKT